MIDLKSVLSKVGWEPTESEPPNDSFSKESQWYEIFSKFGASGFVRTLATDAELVVQAAHPNIEPNEMIKALNQVEDVWSQDSGFFRSNLTSEEFALAAFSKIEALANVLLSDDIEKRFKTFIGEADEFCVAGDSAEGGDFEVIGGKADSKDVQSCSDSFGFQLVLEKHIDLLVGVSPEMNANKFERFGEVMIRNLRAKFDLVPVLGEGRIADGFNGYSHRLHILCEVESDVDSVGEEVREYLQRLNDLSDAGIDPLVFLGVSDSQKVDAREAEQPSTTLRFESDPEDDDVSLDMRSSAARNKLQKGDFEDQRLRGRDATTALVDVVLRHPGYSDKNMGQVLSILLSIEYHEALELIENAPTTLAWGVNRERGQTFKTVIEGAGGKVFLSEPGAFSAA